MSETLTIKRGEGKWVRLVVTAGGVPLSLASAQLFFCMVRPPDTEYVYSATNDEATKWDRTNADDGIIRVNLPASLTSTLELGNYKCEARFIITADTDVYKTERFTLNVISSIISD